MRIVFIQDSKSLGVIELLKYVYTSDVTMVVPAELQALALNVEEFF